MSRTDIVDEAKAQAAMELLREINPKAAIITTPIEKLDGAKILEVMEHPVSLAGTDGRRGSMPGMRTCS